MPSRIAMFAAWAGLGLGVSAWGQTQALIPDPIMHHRQSKAPVRQAIIAYLKEQPSNG